MSNLLASSPSAFVDFLQQHGIRRCYFVYDENERRVLTSHPQLQPIADFMQRDKRDFHEHEGVFLQVTRKHDVLQGAFIHRTNRGMGAGGTRFWPYDSLEQFLRDGLRLSMGMTHKNSLAGLWWGGGKGVIARPPELDFRNKAVRKSIFQEYGEMMSAMQGCYVTAEDVGTNTEDIDSIFSHTRFTTCISPKLGGSGNPSEPTARGVVRGMQAALEFLDGRGLTGRTVAVQGIGNVGAPLLQFLFEHDVARVIACDINADLVARVQKRFGGDKLTLHAVQKGDNAILFEPCDVLAPCATGAILNARTIPKIRARIICGAANNQLEEPERDDRALHERGILYVPDFLVNRMGIVNCANEQYGYVNNDPYIQQHLDREWHHSIYQMTLRVLLLSRTEGIPPGQSAIQLAEKLSRENHPIFGHRGVLIIRSLVENKWHEQA